jgi:hypothetical protein
MSFLSSVTDIIKPITTPLTGFPGDDCKPARPDCDDGKENKSNYEHKANYDQKSDYDHKGNDDYSKNYDKDDSRHHDNDDHSKQARNDDCSDDGRKGDYQHQGNNDYSKHDGNNNYSNHDNDYSKHDAGWKDAKNDDCQQHKDDCQPQKDYCDPKPVDDCGKDTNHNTGDLLAKCDFSHCDFGSPAFDHSGDMQGTLASMSSGHALDYAIGQLGSADHFDMGHVDIPADTSHDLGHFAHA